ncbi:MAG: hypothetical protein ABIA93_07480 [Candidatus Woesearchaeota archaeon]
MGRIELLDLDGEIGSAKWHREMVQVRLGQEPYLAITGEHKHAELLELFLKTHGLPFELATERGEQVPARKGNGYLLVGAGFVLEKNGILYLYGSSASYNIRPDSIHAAEISALEKRPLVIGELW